ncbi:hypothetical protein ACFQZQ_03040 [Lysobacter koreensis]|uniref:Uncharacterized protein n=1 Tax=Lysobacter koreensis TaxID=266122 RepID=A0ABW2YKS5_9GAMM
MTDHDTTERIARQMCDERNGAGHFDKPRTKRNHWRKRARRLLEIKADSPPWITHLMRACGWRV